MFLHHKALHFTVWSDKIKKIIKTICFYKDGKFRFFEYLPTDGQC